MGGSEYIFFLHQVGHSQRQENRLPTLSFHVSVWQTFHLHQVGSNELSRSVTVYFPGKSWSFPQGADFYSATWTTHWTPVPTKWQRMPLKQSLTLCRRCLNVISHLPCHELVKVFLGDATWSQNNNIINMEPKCVASKTSMWIFFTHFCWKILSSLAMIFG